MPHDTTIPNYPRISHTLPPPRTFAPPPKAKDFNLERALRELAADPVARSLWPDPPKTKKPQSGEQRLCCVCNKPYTPRAHQQRYCGRECYMKACCDKSKAAYYETRTLSERVGTWESCACCSAPFVVENAAQKYCNAQCRNRMKHSKKKMLEATDAA